MPILESIAGKIAASLLTNISKWGYKKLTQSNYTQYESELQKIILETIDDYDDKFEVDRTDKIPFYTSHTLFEELIKYRFTKELDRERIGKLLADNPQIDPPDFQQLETFFDLFASKVNSSDKLEKLNIDDNFKEEVFNISYILRRYRNEILESIIDLKYEIKSANGSAVLIGEWNKQLDEILNNINTFKPITALDRIRSLEERIKGDNIENERLSSRIYFLKAQCLTHLGRKTDKNEISELLIQAYKYQPLNPDFKANAGIAYLNLNEFAKAKDVAEELLKRNEYDIYAWLIKCFLEKDKFADVLSAVPELVKTKKVFQLQMYHWLITNKYIDCTSALKQFGIDIESDYQEEIKVTSANIQILLITATYLLNSYYETEFTVTPSLQDSGAKDNLNFNKGIEILQAVNSAIKGSEIEPYHAYYKFEMYYGDYLLTNNKADLLEMERAFNNIESKTESVIVRLSQAFNSLGDKDAFEKACRLLDFYSNEEKPELYFLNVYNYAAIHDTENAERCFLKYIGCQNTIRRETIINVLSFLRRVPMQISDQGVQTLISLLDSAVFEKPGYRNLLQISLYFRFQEGGLDKASVKELIQTTKKMLDPNDRSLYLNIIFNLCMVGEFLEAKTYLDETVDFSRSSEELKLYCKILYSIEGFKPQLLSILKNWRENFFPDYELTEIELYLFEMFHQWEELAAVAKWASSQWPLSEKFTYLLFLGLLSALDVEGIKNNVNLVSNKDFKNVDYVAPICSALIRASMYREALDLHYRHAALKENVKCRQAYIGFTINFPRGYFIDYPEVNIGCFVKYQIKEIVSIVEITDTNKSRFPQSNLIGKKVGETYKIPMPLNEVMEEVTILRICNKYLALCEEIQIEAENPMSGLGFQTFKFDESSPEAFSKQLIQLFGAKGSVESDWINTEFEKYHNGNLSFSEITNSVFRGNPVDAYFTLSDKNGKGFKAITPAISRIVDITGDKAFILDYTSMCLFFELSRDLSITFENKFIVSKYLRELLITNLEEIKITPQAEYSLQITKDRIIPYFYDAKFKDIRIKLFQDLINWVDQNCLIHQVEESMNYIMAISDERNLNSYLRLIMENSLMMNNKNYLLLTNDTIYYRHLNVGPTKVLSPLCYLTNFQSASMDNIVNFLLDKNYIGIPLTSDILTRELYKMLSDQNNKFNICIENLRFNWNPDNSHINQAILFIKSLYTSSFIVSSTRQQVVSTIFSNLIIGMPNEGLKFIYVKLKEEFNLMGSGLVEIISLYSSAINFYVKKGA